ncbi:MAG: ribonuclease HII [Desulfobacterales bacterium]|nr:ribonuclease HII [Desulfobacterales bacterium]
MESNQTNLWTFENQAASQGFKRIAGIDEAGRGPLAGPVVAAAVILPSSFSVPGVTDSKKLSARQRDHLFDEVYHDALSVGIGLVDHAEIDRINILKASLLAMAIAVENLQPQPDYLLIDGTFTIESKLPQEAITKGDARSVSIAAASIVAKVSRDRLMERYHEEYPHYDFAKNKGYPTRAHKEALREFGHCRIHRLTFKGVKETQRGLPW